jgi:FkbM family methyltransferase
MPLLRMVELGAAALQGKGWGTATIHEEVKLAISLLPRRGAIVIDAGANRGDWSRAMLGRAGARLETLIAFEPSRAHVALLDAIRDPRFEWVRSGLGEHAEDSTLYAIESGIGSASVFKRRLDHMNVAISYEEPIHLLALDQVAEQRGLDRIDFLKMDVEGNELKVLAGASRLLSTRAIRALSFEFGGCDIDARVFFQDFWYLLREHGYRLFRAAPPSRLLPVAEYTEDLECFRTSNYFAVASDHELATR